VGVTKLVDVLTKEVERIQKLVSNGEIVEAQETKEYVYIKIRIKKQPEVVSTVLNAEKYSRDVDKLSK
jgi:hypothetical protein